MMKNGSGPQKRWNVVIGTPDEENCPVCRAHRDALVSEVIDSEILGPILVQELPADAILRCPCPLCAQARARGEGE